MSGDPRPQGAAPEQQRKWRIDFAQRLAGLTLHRRPWTQRSEATDHDHCAACWARFADDEADAWHEGYATGPDHPQGEGYWWVCPPCFVDLKPDLDWKAANDPTEPLSEA